MVNENYDVMPAKLVVKAMRDSGYKNAAYAIAELTDNAIQAGANIVEILCEEHEEKVKQRTRRRVKRIAVVDNGCGMNADVLRAALQFGNGTRLDDRSGIGRFGMGLPNSSLSQARRVDVYSWQNGIENALHTYLDVDEIGSGDLRQVPEPTRAEIPAQWIRMSDGASASKSGTVVIWSRLDRCDWKTAHAIFRNSELTTGRIYRKKLVDGGVRIRMAAFLEDENDVHFTQDAKPNDPMYLMSGTSCPEPWASTPMFEPYGSESKFTWRDSDGNDHNVFVRYSIAKRVARFADNAGRLPHGDHAKGNIGVSIIRAERELELQVEWCIGYDPRERWWGVEIDFPPALDEVFGVTNNKQSATTLSDIAKIGLDQVAQREGFSSEQELRDAWEEDGDPRIVLVLIKNDIESNLKVIRSTLKAMTEGKRSSKRRHGQDSAEVIGTKATRRRQEDGHVGASDEEEKDEPSIRKGAIEQELQEQGVNPLDATEQAGRIVDDGRKYDFYRADLHSPEFFTVRRKGGALLIGLNTNHPAYDRLVTVLEIDSEDDIEDLEVEALQGRLQRSYQGLKLLLEAWARYEDELTDGPRRERAQEARSDWGRIARQFFRED